ncbi:MAG: hypothetical protein MN733_28460, partial [Nitrososphaera sp.]|nr:hypothetical protein [Nitrososphaera sp.]
MATDKYNDFVSNVAKIEGVVGSHWAKVLDDCSVNKCYKRWADTTKQIRCLLNENAERFEMYYASLKDLAKYTKDTLEDTIFVRSNRVGLFVRTILSRILY